MNLTNLTPIKILKLLALERQGATSQIGGYSLAYQLKARRLKCQHPILGVALREL